MRCLRRTLHGSAWRCWPPLSAGTAFSYTTRLYTTPVSTTSTASGATGEAKSTANTPVSLSYTCRLLESICAADQSKTVKQKRLCGAVRKMESDIVGSFADVNATLSPIEKQSFIRRWLQSLAACVEYLPLYDRDRAANRQPEAERYSTRSARRTRSAAVDDEDEAWSGASPFFSLQTNDVLCLCLRECAMEAGTNPNPDLLFHLLRCAVALELGDVEVLQHLVRSLTKGDVCRHKTPSEMVRLLHSISLAVKRCKLPVPPLDRVLCVLPGASLSSRENLMVLCAVHRMRGVNASEVVASVSRKAASQAQTYNVKDVIYGLEVAALLPGCEPMYAAALLDQAGVLASTMTPRQLGTVCKYVALVNPSRRHNSLALSCAPELRRVLPLLVERAEQLLGQFHLRDSRYVLRCFREHKVRHSLIFSRLTPIAEDS